MRHGINYSTHILNTHLRHMRQALKWPLKRALGVTRTHQTLITFPRSPGSSRGCRAQMLMASQSSSLTVCFKYTCLLTPTLPSSLSGRMPHESFSFLPSWASLFCTCSLCVRLVLCTFTSWKDPRTDPTTTSGHPHQDSTRRPAFHHSPLPLPSFTPGKPQSVPYFQNCDASRMLRKWIRTVWKHWGLAVFSLSSNPLSFI